ncbi:MAG: glutathione S-transferase family protein [Hyphomicrobiaceae bacterium]
MTAFRVNLKGIGEMILVHHLRTGRPIFTVWLLEELGLDYELKIYLRDAKTMRAQADLKEAHPLGKSPVIEDDGLKLSESGAIASYLIDNYDKDHSLAPLATERTARAVYTQWLHYSEGSAFLPLLVKLVLTREEEPKPVIFSRFAAAEVPMHLNYIQDFLGDKNFLLGDRLQGPDFGMGYILQLAQRVGEIGPYPKLESYLGRMMDRPAFQRAKQRAGE